MKKSQSPLPAQASAHAQGADGGVSQRASQEESLIRAVAQPAVLTLVAGGTGGPGSGQTFAQQQASAADQDAALSGLAALFG